MILEDERTDVLRLGISNRELKDGECVSERRQAFEQRHLK